MVSFSNLPDDITVLIFSRLPVKSVGRCRCLSKSWLALLSQPNFIRNHLNLSSSLRKESLLFSGSFELSSLYSAPLSDALHLFDENTNIATKLNFANHPDFWRRVHPSCDGLVLVWNIEGYKFVLNPVTRQIIQVPELPPALRPAELVIMYGLGYDSLNDDYKIVRLSFFLCIFYGSDCLVTFVRIYSLKTGTWRAVESPVIAQVVYHHNASGIHVDGYMHWVAYSTVCSKPIITAFDLAEGKYRQVGYPANFLGNHDNHDIDIAVLDGHLCVYSKTQTVFWVMKEYGVEESWTKLAINCVDVTQMSPLCMLGEGEEEVVLKDGVKLVIGNLKEGSLKDVVITSPVSDRLIVQTSFVESLISPHSTK